MVTRRELLKFIIATPALASILTFPEPKQEKLRKDLLDAYVEGTWTPSLLEYEKGSFIYKTNYCRYTKLGDQVVIYVPGQDSITVKSSFTVV